MNIFKSNGFDTLIGVNTTIRGSLNIAPDSTAVIDGTAYLDFVTGSHVDGKVSGKTTLRVNGSLSGPTSSNLSSNLDIEVQNIVVNGNVNCNEIRVEGTLAVKSGAKLNASKIFYRTLIIETGAVVHGQMFHLDYVSEGEQT